MYDISKLTFKHGDVCHVRLPHSTVLSVEEAENMKRTIEALLSKRCGFQVPVIITPYGVNLSKVPGKAVHQSYKESEDASRSDDANRVEVVVPVLA